MIVYNSKQIFPASRQVKKRDNVKIKSKEAGS